MTVGHGETPARERRIEALGEGPFDLLVVGGGILGACVARDAALRGLSTALVERNDFASGTSSNSLKVIHGGLRHLQHLDLAEFRRSVAERRSWLRIAPHLVEPLPVLVPFTTRREGVLLRAGLAANDLLAPARNRKVLPERHLPPGRILDRSAAAERMGPLAVRGMRGAALYYDAIMYSPERLVLAVLESAVKRGAVAVNHAECTGPLVENGRRTGVLVRDRLEGDRFPIRARGIVIACGPWSDAVEACLLDRPAPAPVPLSLAWNLVVPAMGPEAAVALPGGTSTPTGSRMRRPRRLFLVPWRGRTLVGTGHAPFEGNAADFDGLEAGDAVVRSFLDEVNEALPGDPLLPADALRIHAGLLPAVETGEDSRVRLRRTPIVRVEGAGGIPLVTVTTVKFTASRRVAERAVDRVARAGGRTVPRSRAASTLLPSAPEDGMGPLARDARQELADHLPPDVIDHLVRSHGRNWRDVAAWRGADPGWADRLDPAGPVVRAELLHGARRELAATPEDLLCRRTEVGARGPVSDALLAAARAVLGAS